MRSEFNQELLRNQIKITADEISILCRKKFELKKELLQEIHKFKIGDFVVYSDVKGKLIYGRIDIINNTNQTKGGQAIVYRALQEGGNKQASDYQIIYLHDWAKEPDPRLRVISRHELEQLNNPKEGA